jgi:hypothetical protein
MYESTTARAIDCRNLIPVAIRSCTLHQLRAAERCSSFLPGHLTVVLWRAGPENTVFTLVVYSRVLSSRVISFGGLCRLSLFGKGAMVRSWYVGCLLPVGDFFLLCASRRTYWSGVKLQVQTRLPQRDFLASLVSSGWSFAAPSQDPALYIHVYVKSTSRT